MRIRISHTLPRFIEALQRAPEVVMAHVDLAVMRVSIEGAREAKGNAPKALSTLVNSIRNERVGLAFHRIVAAADHGKAVEEGLKPGVMPPLEPIRRWIRVKNIQPQSASTERGLAFLIARKIQRDGTRPQPFMKPVEQSSRARLAVMIPVAARRGLEAALA